MEFLQSREWGLMILDGKLLEIINLIIITLLEVQTIPADKFRKVLSGNVATPFYVLSSTPFSCSSSLQTWIDCYFSTRR